MPVTTERPAWLPARYTPPLRPDLVTDGDRLISVVSQLWTMPDDSRLELDDWQRWLLRHVLERYPADWPVESLRGRLRYRQVVISMGRQNGKSVLGALLGFYGLAMHDPGPEVIGLASSTDQANIVYNRVLHAIKSARALAARFKPTGTRGITYRRGAGSYKVKPAKGDALQGIPVSLCIFDELHIAKPDMWAAVVNGQRTRTNGILIGITTAGDDDSELLLRLYKDGAEAIDGEHERFGFFCWEAPEGATIETPGAIEAANPSVACGRVDVETVRADVRRLPEPDQVRYVLNRFTSSSSAWLPMRAWQEAAGSLEVPGSPAAFTIARTPSWEHGCITATTRLEDGRYWTELAASIVRPSLEQLEDICQRLHARVGGGVTFALDAITLGALGERLKERGLEVRFLRLGDRMQAGPAAYSLITSGRVVHAGDPLTAAQMPRAKRKNVGDGWRLSAGDSSGDIDAVLATVDGLFVADALRARGVPIY